MFRIKILSIIVLLLTIHCHVLAQEGEGISVFLHPKKFYKKYFPHLKIKKPNIDSTYIKSYPHYLTLGSRLIVPTIYMDLHSNNSKENSSSATSNFRTNVGNIVAFSASYRFITAGFALVLSSNRKDNEDYTPSSYRTATVKYNGSSYSLQFKFIRIRGFTDVNENNSDTSIRYTKREDMLLREYQFEGVYNFSWKKYSYYAPIDYTFRQLKTHLGFLLKAGAYYNQVSADSNFLTIKQRTFFNDFTDIRIIRTTSFKLAPGVGLNLVFLKRFYFSVAVFTPYNFYVYNYFTKDENLIHKGTSIAFVLDGNVCLGYQSERFYAGFRYQADSKSVTFNTVSLNSLFSYVGFDVGYRFEAPKFMRKFYKQTMPPGM